MPGGLKFPYPGLAKIPLTYLSSVAKDATPPTVLRVLLILSLQIHWNPLIPSISSSGILFAFSISYDYQSTGHSLVISSPPMNVFSFDLGQLA